MGRPAKNGPKRNSPIALRQWAMDNRYMQPENSPQPASVEDQLARQMRELGTQNYWEAVALYAERQRIRDENPHSLSVALLGFRLF